MRVTTTEAHDMFDDEIWNDTSIHQMLNIVPEEEMKLPEPALNHIGPTPHISTLRSNPEEEYFRLVSILQLSKNVFVNVRPASP